jgi:hypothetical protein
MLPSRLHFSEIATARPSGMLTELTTSFHLLADDPPFHGFKFRSPLCHFKDRHNTCETEAQSHKAKVKQVAGARCRFALLQNAAKCAPLDPCSRPASMDLAGPPSVKTSRYFRWSTVGATLWKQFSRREVSLEAAESFYRREKPGLRRSVCCLREERSVVSR